MGYQDGGSNTLKIVGKGWFRTPVSAELINCWNCCSQVLKPAIKNNYINHCKSFTKCVEMHQGIMNESEGISWKTLYIKIVVWKILVVKGTQPCCRGKT